MENAYVIELGKWIYVIIAWKSHEKRWNYTGHVFRKLDSDSSEVPSFADLWIMTYLYLFVIHPNKIEYVIGVLFRKYVCVKLYLNLYWNFEKLWEDGWSTGKSK